MFSIKSSFTSPSLYCAATAKGKLDALLQTENEVMCNVKLLTLIRFNKGIELKI